MPTANCPIIDLRSDAVSLPSAAMRAAIGGARYGEDPSVAALERQIVVDYYL